MRRTEKRAGKPGIVVYFDKMRQNLAHLDDTQAGRLLRAMLAYGETQTEPDFTDDILLAALWERVRDDLDVDDARYSKRKNDTELKSAWGKYCGQAKADGEKPISFGEWKRRLKDDPHITAVNSQPSESNLQSSSINPQISERVSLSRARARGRAHRFGGRR
ncbi:MAG: DUF6291 domain-containing protein [Lachnospiraceae bacterium]|nr:DUF6291 domain-containing protein [Lachnospiraceae bacterium]